MKMTVKFQIAGSADVCAAMLSCGVLCRTGPCCADYHCSHHLHSAVVSNGSSKRSRGPGIHPSGFQRITEKLSTTARSFAGHGGSSGGCPASACAGAGSVQRRVRGVLLGLRQGERTRCVVAEAPASGLAPVTAQLALLIMRLALPLSEFASTWQLASGLQQADEPHVACHTSQRSRRIPRFFNPWRRVYRCGGGGRVVRSPCAVTRVHPWCCAPAVGSAPTASRGEAQEVRGVQGGAVLLGGLPARALEGAQARVQAGDRRRRRCLSTSPRSVLIPNTALPPLPALKQPSARPYLWLSGSCPPLFATLPCPGASATNGVVPLWHGAAWHGMRSQGGGSQVRFQPWLLMYEGSTRPSPPFPPPAPPRGLGASSSDPPPSRSRDKTFFMFITGCGLKQVVLPTSRSCYLLLLFLTPHTLPGFDVEYEPWTDHLFTVQWQPQGAACLHDGAKGARAREVQTRLVN